MQVEVDEETIKKAIATEKSRRLADLQARLQRIDAQRQRVQESYDRNVSRVEDRVRRKAASYAAGRSRHVCHEAIVWVAHDTWTWAEARLLLCGLIPLPHDLVVRARIREFSAAYGDSLRLRDLAVAEEADLQEEVGLYRTIHGLQLWNNFSEFDPDWETSRQRMIFRYRNRMDLLHSFWTRGNHAQSNAPDYYFDWLEAKINKPSLSKIDFPEMWWKELALDQESTHLAAPPTLPPAPSTPVARQRTQEAAILTWLGSAGHNPKRLPRTLPGKAGIKDSVRKAMLEHPTIFVSKGVFDKAWDRLRGSGEIAEASPNLG